MLSVWTALVTIALTAGLLQAQKPNPLYGAHGVSAIAVRQGYLGSCYFHAAVSALANAHPEAIRNAIRLDDTGSYRVKFVDGPEETVYVEDLTFAETHSFDRSDGEWVGVLMRAYAQRVLRQSLSKAVDKSEDIPTFLKPAAHSALEDSNLVLQAWDHAIRAVISQNGTIDKAALKAKLTDQGKTLGVPTTAIQTINGFLDQKGVFDDIATTVQHNGEFFGAYRSFGQGGIPSQVMQAFLGAAHTDFPARRERVLASLKKVNSGGTAMVAESGTTGPTDPGKWWLPDHAFTVLGFDESTQTVSMRNPWGEHPDPDGNFTIPLAVFFQAFNVYSLSGPDTP
jgi:hypothetical protein